MTAYVDSSALLKRYVEEADSELAEHLLAADPVLVTSWVSLVEVRRNLARLVDPAELPALRAQLVRDLDAFALVSVDPIVCESAAEIGELLGLRTLDALHLASARRLQIPGLSFITFDLRQAQAARSLGFTVLGA
jgi:predicted nucleic acid-binding protein